MLFAMHCDNLDQSEIWPILIGSNRGISDKVRLGTGFEGAACLEGACSTDPIFPTPSAKGISDTIFEEEGSQEQSARTAGSRAESFLKAAGCRRRGCRDGRRDARRCRRWQPIESGQKRASRNRSSRGVCRPNCFAFCPLERYYEKRQKSEFKTSRCSVAIAFASEDFRMRPQSTIRRACGIHATWRNRTRCRQSRERRVSWDEAARSPGRSESIQTNLASAVAFLTAFRQSVVRDHGAAATDFLSHEC